MDNFTIDGYNNIQYHAPAGLIPFGTTFKIAYAPGLDATQNSANAGGAGVTRSATNMGSSATEMQLTTSPIEGLTVGASYISFEDSGSSTKLALEQEPESGALYAKYKVGNLGVGYSLARASTLLEAASSGTAVEWYEQKNYSIAYVVNDSLSLSYEKETSDPQATTASTVTYEQDSSAIQAAYTMGGMTFAVSLGKFDNNGYVNNADAEQALFAVTMAF